MASRVPRDVAYSQKVGGRIITVLVGGQTLVKVHSPEKCANDKSCCIHNPSAHHMRDWDQSYTPRSKIMWRRCEHGSLHPDPDNQPHLRLLADIFHIEDCDGCCEIEEEQETF